MRFFFFQAEDGIRDYKVTGVQTCALPILEAIVNGRYYWIPFARLSEVRIEKPADLRDIAWTPAYLTLANGGEDRKSTRLNSSHLVISYAVFCLTKKERLSQKSSASCAPSS